MATLGPNNEYVGNARGQWIASKTKVLTTFSNGNLYSTFMENGVPYQVPSDKTAKIVGASLIFSQTTAGNFTLHSSTAATSDVLQAAPAGVANIPTQGQSANGLLFDGSATAIIPGFYDILLSASVAASKYINLKVSTSTTVQVILYVQEV